MTKEMKKTASAVGTVLFIMLFVVGALYFLHRDPNAENRQELEEQLQALEQQKQELENQLDNMQQGMEEPSPTRAVSDSSCMPRVTMEKADLNPGVWVPQINFHSGYQIQRRDGMKISRVPSEETQYVEAFRISVNDNEHTALMKVYDLRTYHYSEAFEGVGTLEYEVASHVWRLTDNGETHVCAPTPSGIALGNWPIYVIEEAGEDAGRTYLILHPRKEDSPDRFPVLVTIEVQGSGGESFSRFLDDVDAVAQSIRFIIPK